MNQTKQSFGYMTAKNLDTSHLKTFKITNFKHYNLMIPLYVLVMGQAPAFIICKMQQKANNF